MNKALFVFALLALFCIVQSVRIEQERLDNALVYTEEIEKAVNSNPSAGWVAGKNKFSTWTIGEVKRILGASLTPTERYSDEMMKIIQKMAPKSNDLPDNFDSRTQWPKCVHPIRNQLHCGSCWAFSATEALSDRFCIASNGTVDDLVSCDWYNMGCNGGILRLAWFYMKHSGVVSDACFPYTSGDGVAPKCATTCKDSGKPFKEQKYYAEDYHHVGSLLTFWEREKKIMEEIHANGPVQTGFSVYEDFMSYKSGVYKHVTGGLLGGHAVKIVGWGTTSDGTKYWIIANSWGTDWGQDGFFWIQKGNNECGVEGDVFAGPPDLKHLPSH